MHLIFSNISDWAVFKTIFEHFRLYDRNFISRGGKMMKITSLYKFIKTRFQKQIVTNNNKSMFVIQFN